MASSRLVTIQLLIALVIVESIYLAYQSSLHKPVVTLWNDYMVTNQDERNITKIIYQYMDDIKEFHPSKGAGNVPHLHDQKKLMQDDMHKFQDQEPDKPLTIELYKDYLQVQDDWRKTLREQHKAVVEKIPKLVPGTVKGRGIVMTGGGNVFGNALIGIRFNIEYHPGIPIELWLSRAEYEPLYCEQILPAYNVTCMIFEDQLGPEIERFDFTGYPSKSLALMGSRFEEIYFTDIDSFAMYSIHDLFESEVYKAHGFISWPDYWLRVTTPDYYDVAGVFDLDLINPNLELIKIPGTVSDQLASEAGQMVFNKTEHWDTIFLSAYYNLNGNDYYYRLLSIDPNVDGFGDKETWISAAAALGHPGYQVREYLIMMGFHEENGGYHHSAMVQRDPIADYRRHVMEKNIPSDQVKAYIIHANSMKLNPFFLFADLEETTFQNPSLLKRPRRLLGNLDEVKKFFDHDVELRLFQVVQNVICSWLVSDMPGHAPEQDMKETCKAAKAHVKWLEKNKVNPW